MEPKKSGDSLDDCIEYVRRKMYKENNKLSGKNDESDVDSETEDIPEENGNKSGEETEEATSDKSGEEVPLSSEVPDTSVVHKNPDKDSDSSYHASDDDDDEDDDVPVDYLFPSYMAFVLWGPYVEPCKRLNLILTDDKNLKKGVGSRSQQRSAIKAEKLANSKVDTTAERGFSTEQRLEIETNEIRREEMNDRKKESILVGISIEEAAISRLIEAAERRAEMRCKEYNQSNKFWQKVDELMVKQEDIMKRMEEFNKVHVQVSNGECI